MENCSEIAKNFLKIQGDNILKKSNDQLPDISCCYNYKQGDAVYQLCSKVISEKPGIIDNLSKFITDNNYNVVPTLTITVVILILFCTIVCTILAL
jgi:hypothetical protein